MVVAPSGARADWFRTEVEAATEAARRTQEKNEQRQLEQ